MTRPVHKSSRGATLRIFLEVFQDDDSLIDGTETVTAVLKALDDEQADLPGDNAPVAMTLTVTWQAASGDNLAGWYFTGSAADTGALMRGYYVTDARIVLGNGEVEYAQPVTVDLREHVTGPA